MSSEDQQSRLRVEKFSSSPTNDVGHEQNHAEILLRIVDGITPDRLGNTSYSKIVEQVAASVANSIRYDSTNLLLLIRSIKECTKPCYKRDVLLDVMDFIIFSDNTILSKLLSDTFRDESMHPPWKEMANSVASLPDLIANCGALGKLTNFEASHLYAFVLDKLHQSLESLPQSTTSKSGGHSVLRHEQKLFYIQLVGRIAISGFNQMVWERFTSKAMTADEARGELKAVVADILTLPLHSDNRISSQFDIFIEPLYFPIFYNLKPSEVSGRLIKSILGENILRRETFEYFICNKSILQTNYHLERDRQQVLLFNIFAYISQLCDTDCDSNSSECVTANEQPAALDRSGNEGSSLLIKTLLELVKSWSNGTKILLRSFEQSRYISCAFIILFRFALKCDKQGLAKYAEKIQSHLVQGFPVYLNRASAEHRDLAMCVGQILFPKLYEIIDSCPVDGRQQQQKKRQDTTELEFDIKSHRDFLDFKLLFESDIEKIFHDFGIVRDQAKVDNPLQQREKPSSKLSSNEPKTKKPVASNSSVNKHEKAATAVATSIRRGKSESHKSSKSFTPPKRAVIELLDDDNDGDANADEDDDDLPPNDNDGRVGDNCCVDDDADVDNYEDCANVPIYLSDCINGLAENNNPRFVRLCLIKAGELIRQLSKQEADDHKTLANLTTTKRQQQQQQQNQLKYTTKPCTNDDAIRDIGVELARLLLYVDDQFNLEQFDAYRRRALSSLCLAAPDLVVKYLLDEFNGSTRNTRHQLDILQVLVDSARQMSGMASSNDVGGVGDDGPAAMKAGGKVVSGGGGHQRRREEGTTNRFAKYASLYFYGIVNQLKADLNIISVSPIASIVSAARTITASPSNSDDSYLLSRILLSTSLIIRCLHQQPIVCKLSNDFLDILAAYRCHPDEGVRRAISASLTVIRDCTPSVFFDECLSDKTMSLFAQWLASESELFGRMRIGRGDNRLR